MARSLFVVLALALCLTPAVTAVNDKVVLTRVNRDALELLKGAEGTMPLPKCPGLTNKLAPSPITSAVGAHKDFACNMCNQFADQALQNLINIFMQVGIEGGCAGLCSQVPGPSWIPTVCDLACTVVGIEEFSNILSKVDLDTFYFCELVELCTVTDGGMAQIASFAVNPKKGEQGETFEIQLAITVTNETGTGEVVVELDSPEGFPAGAGNFHGVLEPGTYQYAWDVDTSQVSEDQPWSPGKYTVKTAFCQGECGSKHPHSVIYAEGETSFEIEE